RHFAGQTDSRGAVIVPELTPGTRVLAYVFNPEKNAAGIFDTVLPAQDGKMEVGKLLPAKSGKIVMTNMEEEPVDGRIYGVMSAEGGRQRLRLNSRMLVKKRKGVYEVKGMVPGATYKVTGWVRGYRRGWHGGFKEWKVEGDEKHPKLALKFERAQRRRRSLTNPVNSKADFVKKVKALNSAEWKKQDPYAHHLSWCIDEGAMVLANARERTVKRFPGLFGFDNLAVNNVAFGPRKVWAATNHGVIAWDRKMESWSRYAPDVENLEMPAKTVSTSKNGTVRVVLEPQKGKEKAYKFDPSTMRWHEDN
ncbi:MAG: hypothetical protein KGZ25_07075, partial [Planctomycetes bacterium]|nr:hypothetical protein [Planctomycetota bacterium]